MTRREALSRVSLLLGGTIIGANIFLEGCKPADRQAKTGLNFDGEDIAYLDEIAETIIPQTTTAGAKAAKVGTFMTVMIRDCYEEKDQKAFREGMNKLNEASEKKYDKSFMEANGEQRHDLLVEVDNETKDYTAKKKKEDANHYFRLMKELTLLGYFTSEQGMKESLRYVESPGKFEPCIPYNKGDKAWALS